jgi:hypothetical protein
MLQITFGLSEPVIISSRHRSTLPILYGPVVVYRLYLPFNFTFFLSWCRITRGVHSGDYALEDEMRSYERKTHATIQSLCTQSQTMAEMIEKTAHHESIPVSA